MVSVCVFADGQHKCIWTSSVESINICLNRALLCCFICWMFYWSVYTDANSLYNTSCLVANVLLSPHCNIWHLKHKSMCHAFKGHRDSLDLYAHFNWCCLTCLRLFQNTSLYNQITWEDQEGPDIFRTRKIIDPARTGELRSWWIFSSHGRLLLTCASFVFVLGGTSVHLINHRPTKCDSDAALGILMDRSAVWFSNRLAVPKSGTGTTMPGGGAATLPLQEWVLLKTSPCTTLRLIRSGKKKNKTRTCSQPAGNCIYLFFYGHANI